MQWHVCYEMLPFRAKGTSLLYALDPRAGAGGDASTGYH